MFRATYFRTTETHRYNEALSLDPSVFIRVHLVRQAKPN